MLFTKARQLHVKINVIKLAQQHSFAKIPTAVKYNKLDSDIRNTVVEIQIIVLILSNFASE